MVRKYAELDALGRITVGQQSSSSFSSSSSSSFSSSFLSPSSSTVSSPSSSHSNPPPCANHVDADERRAKFHAVCSQFQASVPQVSNSPSSSFSPPKLLRELVLPARIKSDSSSSSGGSLLSCFCGFGSGDSVGTITLEVAVLPAPPTMDEGVEETELIESALAQSRPVRDANVRYTSRYAQKRLQILRMNSNASERHGLFGSSSSFNQNDGHSHAAQLSLQDSGKLLIDETRSVMSVFEWSALSGACLGFQHILLAWHYPGVAHWQSPGIFEISLFSLFFLH